jgi:beta propeller repeat protein
MVPAEFNPVKNPEGEDAIFPITAQATDNLTPVVDLTLEIRAAGASGDPLYTQTVRTDSGIPHIFIWNGRGTGGALLPPGNYSALLRAADPLDHSVEETVDFSILEPFASQDLFAGNGEQLYPQVGGDIAVWQDYRSGNWDIYMYNYATQSGSAVSTQGANQERPRVNAGRVVWQDNRNGNYDIYMRDLNAGTTAPVFTGAGNQVRPTSMVTTSSGRGTMPATTTSTCTRSPLHRRRRSPTASRSRPTRASVTARSSMRTSAPASPTSTCMTSPARLPHA